MSTDESSYYQEVPKAEFKDTPARVQYIQCGILLVGGLLGWLLWNSAGHNLTYYISAAVAVLAAVVAAIVVQKTLGNKSYLQHFEDRIVLADDDKVQDIPFDQLQAYSASWTDLYVNGVYNTSTVRLSFDVAGSFRVHQYESAASYGTLKYEQLQALQVEVSEVIAAQMRETLLEEGSVAWTAQMTMTTEGIEYRKKGTAEAELISYPRLGKWEVDSGLFKLAFDDDRRPTVTETISQTNFFPGLQLFSQLHEEFSKREDLSSDRYQDPLAEELVEV